ncbi:acyltransferase family protein [Enteractinococcus helveticum]|uniref:Acyltransferase n=1 Tax=Enteractinococcus helveticum TaxID=1837282 RepID=A0A1B7LXR4_9MICC|nr:acyltransferase family protein [Enteractinococcus helveticum]OAV59957.1 hypothetical protein A6F49_14545 [Enteractinococcus helveticum]
MTITGPHRTDTSEDRLEKGLPERRYLPELHGVRGLALTWVVLFHLFGDGRVSGGIDIFLAVSGFLFTGMLLREAAASGGRIDVLRYYGRLVRRILVPAAIVVAATLAAGLLLAPVTQHRQLWAEARASLLYFENIELINSQLSYGAAGPDTSPFQHFWSLSVQGQFYLVWPALAIIAVIVAKRFQTSAAKVMAIMIGVVFIGSFAYAIYVGRYDQSAAYLMTTTRAWELGFGGLLALGAGTLRLPQPLRAPAGWLGLMLIISCGFVLDGGRLFPGPWALWPLLGFTLVLISAGPTGGNRDPKHTATRFLSNRPLAWIGHHAYSLYLWHWPLLIYYLEIWDLQALNLTGALIVLAVSVALAMLTYRYIEQPLQRLGKKEPTTQRRINRTTVLAGASTLIVAGFTMSAFTQPPSVDTTYGDLDPEVYPGANVVTMDGELPQVEAFPAVENVDAYQPAYLDRDCAQLPGQDPGTDEVMVCQDEDAPEHPTATIVLAGGSHAGHLEAAFKTLARKYHWEVLVVIKSGCSFGFEELPNEAMCESWNHNFIDWLHDHPADLVVTPGTRLDGPEEYIFDATPQWWEQIVETGTELLLIRGTPRNDFWTPDCLADGGTPQECGPPKEIYAEENPLLSMDLPANTHHIDLTEYVCPNIHDDTTKNCDAVVGNIMVTFDFHHFTAPFSQSLAPSIEAEMQDVVPHLLR